MNLLISIMNLSISNVLFNSFSIFIFDVIHQQKRYSLNNNLLFIFRKQCPCSPKLRRKEQQTCPCSTDQTFAAIREAARQEGKCTPCAEPPPCPPCCGASAPKKFADLITKETVKKCGCPVKDYSCNCCKSK